MKLHLFKVKSGKENTWFEWCSLLMTKYKEEALQTLLEEQLLFEGGASFKLNGETYVVALSEGKGLPSNKERELNKKHIEIRKECLEDACNIEVNYELKVN